MLAISLAILLALVMGFFLVRMLNKRLIDPVAQMGEVAKKAADGDLTVDISINSQDEIGRLAQGLNNMIKQMREMVTLIVAKTDIVASNAQQLNSGGSAGYNIHVQNTAFKGASYKERYLYCDIN